MIADTKQIQIGIKEVIQLLLLLTQALLRFLQTAIGEFYGFNIQRLVQEPVADNLGDMPQQIVDIGYIGIQREHKFAHRHNQRGGKQAHGIEAARLLQGHKKQGCGAQIQSDQAVFQADFQCGQPRTRNKGVRNAVWPQQKPQTAQQGKAQYQDVQQRPADYQPRAVMRDGAQ